MYTVSELSQEGKEIHTLALRSLCAVYRMYRPIEFVESGKGNRISTLRVSLELVQDVQTNRKSIEG